MDVYEEDDQCRPNSHCEWKSPKFPTIISKDHRHEIISDWQRLMDFKELAQTPCAVCTQSIAKWDILAVPPDNIDFSLLQNHFLPIETLPTMYNIDAYNRAILYPLALHNVKAQDTIDMCQLCYHLLVICKSSWLIHL